MLICDDSQFARRSVIKALPADLQVTVVEAADGSKALEYCRAGSVDVVLLDLNMPIVDGMTVLQTLQSEGIKLPIMVITANIQSETMLRAKSLGAGAVLQKPIDASLVVSTLRHLIAKRSA
jgi:CheY-like chemotaxis protein